MKQNNDYLIKAGLIFAGYFIIVKPILDKLGITKSAEDTIKEQNKIQAQKDNFNQLKKSGLKLSKSVNEWNLIADTIYNDIGKYSGIDDNDADAGYQLTRVQNDLDIAQLINSFGMRADIVFGISLGKKNLINIVKNNLTTSKIAAIEKNYASKKIKFRF